MGKIRCGRNDIRIDDNQRASPRTQAKRNSSRYTDALTVHHHSMTVIVGLDFASINDRAALVILFLFTEVNQKPPFTSTSNA